MVKEAAAGRLHAPTPTTVASVRHPSHSCGLLARFACLLACLPACLPACLLACLSVVETPRGACLSLPPPPPPSSYLRPTPSFSPASLLYLPSPQLAPVTLPPGLSLVSVPRATITPYPIRRHAPRATSSWRHTLLFKRITLLTLTAIRSHCGRVTGLNYFCAAIRAARSSLIRLCRRVAPFPSTSLSRLSSNTISFTRDPTNIFPNY